jgi:hypothetical protein
MPLRLRVHRFYTARAFLEGKMGCMVPFLSLIRDRVWRASGVGVGLCCVEAVVPTLARIGSEFVA